MSKLKHVWGAIRYGEWSAGIDRAWGKEEGETFFFCKPFYYDGHHFYVRIGWLWFGVSY